MVAPDRGVPLRRPDGGRRGRRAGRARPARTQPPRDPREGAARRPRRCDPDRAGRGSFDHVPLGRRRGQGARPRACRDRAFRRARGHGDGSVGIADRPRTADAPADRGGMDRRGELHPGRTARLLAGPGHVRVDARPGHALAHAGRDGGTRRRGGHRRGDRAGAGRSRPDLPLGRHRRRRPGDGAGNRHTGVRGDARPGAAACGPTDRGSRRPRRDGRRGGLTPRTTTRRSRRCSRST